MHNSLHIQKVLRTANGDPLCHLRRDPHRSVVLDSTAELRSGEFLLDPNWQIQINLPSEAKPVVRKDISDFLKLMRITVTEQASNVLSVSLNFSLPSRGCRLTFHANCIRIEGGDISGIWAGIALFEFEMRTRRGPILPLGVFEYTAAWDIQISQGPWMGNYSVPDFSPEYLSDDAFRLYAHYGVNSMMIYGDLLCYVNSRILPQLNCQDYEKNIEMLQDAAWRAARYGVRFTYVPVAPKLNPDHPVFKNHPDVRGAGIKKNGSLLHFLCSSSSKVLDFYEETFENMFRLVPQLAGLIAITFCESFYHCRIWDHITEKPCKTCSSIPLNKMIARLMQALECGVKKANPDAFTSMWIYWSKNNDRVEFFRELSPEIGLFHHIDKDHKLKKSGYTKAIWDYSVDYQGSTAEMLQLADCAHKEQRPLFVKTETSIGLETIQLPYVPAMQHLAQKWQNVRDLHPYGVHQSWLFFGMFGSRAEELGLWAAYLHDMAADEFLEKVSVRDFGRKATPHVLAAWKYMSMAVTHLPCLHLKYYYIGPSFLGPCHPLVPNADEQIPEVFYAYLFYLQEGEETFSVRQISQARSCMVMNDLPESSKEVGVIPNDSESDGWNLVADEYDTAAEYAHQSCRNLQRAVSVVDAEHDKQQLNEELYLTELIHRTFLTCANTVRFLYARKQWEKKGDAKLIEEMRQLARSERANAVAASVIYREQPWLDLKHRTDGHYHSCVQMIQTKVEWIDHFLTGSKLEGNINA